MSRPVVMAQDHLRPPQDVHRIKVGNQPLQKIEISLRDNTSSGDAEPKMSSLAGASNQCDVFEA